MQINKLLLIVAFLLSFTVGIYSEEGDGAEGGNGTEIQENVTENGTAEIVEKKEQVVSTEKTAKKKDTQSSSGSGIGTVDNLQKQIDSANQQVDKIKSEAYPINSRSKVTGLKNDAKEKITSAKSQDDIDSAVNGFNDKIAEIPTQKKVDSFTSEINSYFKNKTKADDYTLSQLMEIESLKSKCREEIDSSENTADMEEKIVVTKEAIDKVLTVKEKVDELTKKVSELNTKLILQAKGKNLFEFVKEQIPALVTILLGLVILALFIINARITKRKFADDTVANDKTQKSIGEIQVNLKDIYLSLNDLKSNYRSLKGKISDNENSIDNLVKIIELQKTSARVEKVVHEIIPEDPVEDFNNWACNPTKTLPSRFYYLKGDIKIRNEQTIVDSQTESKWITNRQGSKKYLFPNPHSFDEMTDIRELYVISGALRSKGCNAIKITEPCNIADRGYINSPGKLTVL
jgi:hypothetical protein